MTVSRRLRASAPVRLTLQVLLLGAILVAVAPISTSPPRSFAHTPHDQIVHVAVSPAYATDHTLLAISNNHSLRSTDEGQHWVETVHGLGGQIFSRFAWAPSDPEVVYLSSRNGGVFRSDDRGRSWRTTNSPAGMANVDQIAVSPTSANTVIAALGNSGGLYRTVDGGRAWSPVPQFLKIGALMFVPTRAGRVVAGDRTGKFYVSDDKGAHFRRARGRVRGAITAIAPGASAAPGELFAGTSAGQVLRSDDSGNTWSPIGPGIRGEPITSLLVSPNYATNHSIWASAWHTGSYRSTDGGRSWKRQSRGLTTDIQADQIKQAQFRTLAVAPLDRGRQLLFLAGYDGLFSSDDGGSHWHSIETQAEYLTGLAVSPDFPRDGTVIVNAYVKGVYISRDGGGSFDLSIDGLQQRALGEGNRLLPVRRMHNVAFSPAYATDHTIFTATWDRFVKSTDGGRTWQSILVEQVPASETLRQFVIGVSPDYANDRTIWLGTRQGDVYRSTQAGNAHTWTTLTNLHSGVRSVAVSPGYAGDRTLFVSTSQGIYRSTDGGASWTSTGPAGIALLAISPAYARDHTLFAGTDHGVYVTTDGAAAWKAVTGALPPSAPVAAIAVSPSFLRDRTMLVSVTGVGLFRSTDGGKSFQPAATDLVELSMIIADFDNPTSEPIQFSPAYATDQTVYAYAQQSVVRSTDGGSTWSVLSIPPAADFPFRQHATTGGGGHETLVVVLVVLAGALLTAIAAVTIYRRRVGRARVTA